jgi:hypothetical protein
LRSFFAPPRETKSHFSVKLSQKIQEEEGRINRELEYLAQKRDLSPEELAKLILNDEISL